MWNISILFVPLDVLFLKVLITSMSFDPSLPWFSILSWWIVPVISVENQVVMNYQLQVVIQVD